MTDKKLSPGVCGYIAHGNDYWNKVGFGVTKNKDKAHLYTFGWFEENKHSLPDGARFEPAICAPMSSGVIVPDLSKRHQLRNKTSAERKGEPVVTGFLRYFPDAVAAAARLSKAGNEKHNPGEPLHWARTKSTDQDDCAGRHILTPDAIDPETGETELVAAFWRMGAAVQLQQERLLKEKGIMPYSGIVPDGDV